MGILWRSCLRLANLISVDTCYRNLFTVLLLSSALRSRMNIGWWSSGIDHRLLQSLRISKHHMFFVHDRMAKLIFESILLQELLNSDSNKRNSQDLVNSGSPMHINGQHLSYQVSKLTRKMHWNLIELSANNMHS